MRTTIIVHIQIKHSAHSIRYFCFTSVKLLVTMKRERERDIQEIEKLLFPIKKKKLIIQTSFFFLFSLSKLNANTLPADKSFIFHLLDRMRAINLINKPFVDLTATRISKTTSFCGSVSTLFFYIIIWFFYERFFYDHQLCLLCERHGNYSHNSRNNNNVKMCCLSVFFFSFLKYFRWGKI